MFYFLFVRGDTINTDNLINFRKSIGLTQTEMAKVIGVQKSTYTCYENMIRIISITKLNIISNKYGKSLDFLSGNSLDSNIKFTKKDFTLEEVGNILKNERQLQGMTQKDLSEKFNVAQSRISDYEKGKGLTIPVLIQYSKLFDKPIDYLCGKTLK